MLAAHFAQASARARAGVLETTLHRLAKQPIADGARLLLPEVAAEHGGLRRLVRPTAAVRAETAALEPGLGGLRPDVVATVARRPLLVGVAVTHPCGPEKVALIRQRRLAAVEVDLSWLARDAPPEAIERALLRSAPRRWLWNRHAEAAEAEMRAAAERVAARRARGWRRWIGSCGSSRPRGRRVGAAAQWSRRPAAGARGGGGARGRARRLNRDGGAGRRVLRRGARGLAIAAHRAARAGRRPARRRGRGGALRPLLRRGFAEAAPGGFGWTEIAARCPALRPPSEVVADYARALGVMGLLARGSDGLWRPARAGAAARDRHGAVAAGRMGPPRAPARGRARHV